MPQLWLTYEELGDEFGCDAAEARTLVIRRGWTRKHSSDGMTRVLIPPDTMADYFEAHSRSNRRPTQPPVAASSSAADQLRRLLSAPPTARDAN